MLFFKTSRTSHRNRCAKDCRPRAKNKFNNPSCEQGRQAVDSRSGGRGRAAELLELGEVVAEPSEGKQAGRRAEPRRNISGMPSMY